MGMTIDEKFKALENEYTYLAGKYQMMQADYNARLKADKVAMLKEIREEIEHCSLRYNLAREQGYQGQVVWSEYLYKQGDVLAILDKKISELEEKEDGTKKN